MNAPRRAVPVTLLALAALALGCSDPIPQVVEPTIRVAVSTDIPTADDDGTGGGGAGGGAGNTAHALDAFGIKVYRGDTGPWFTGEYDLVELERLPDTLLLHNAQPRDDQGNIITTEIQIELRASLQGVEHLVRKSKLRFPSDRPVLLHMPLCDSCWDVDCSCNANPALCERLYTCKEGECQLAEPSIDSLPVDDGTQSLTSAECP
jgi:hypothetical protein